MSFKPGDRVRCVESCGEEKLTEGNVYTVKRTEGSYVAVTDDNDWWAQRRFVLVEPASPWIPGPPPESCINAIVCDPRISEGQPFADHKGFRGEWPARIVRHIPIDIPPAPVEPLPLPRRFRGKYGTVDVVGILQHSGNRAWFSIDDDWGDTPERRSQHLTDIEFVDPE